MSFSTVREFTESVRDKKKEVKYVEIGFPKVEFLEKSAYYVDSNGKAFKDKKKAIEGTAEDARNVGEASTDISTWTWYDTRNTWRILS